LARNGASHGTVIATDFQSSGYGRTKGRIWDSSAGKNLLFTIILRFADYREIPALLTLRTGLALAFALLEAEPSLSGILNVKWPNDILLSGKKICGILTESDGKNVFTGIGLNVAQEEFLNMPKATSILNEMQDKKLSICGSYKNAPYDRFFILEKFLKHFIMIIDTDINIFLESLNGMLYKKNSQVRFRAGSAENFTEIDGIVQGIDCEGGLQIRLNGSNEIKSFSCGEIIL
ncbi:MAG: biotin--[acetyl-CoA-carboxylase] ligase, partial [Spirochaetaceae bacterium]|nr:biotin--[acetyl-CoA-carboxylase] ligase [Spirochaetaceae bacterium]